MITPVRYAGWSGRSSQASANISTGPTTQESKSERPKKRRFETPSGSCAELLVADLREDRVHHQEQAERRSGARRCRRCSLSSPSFRLGTSEPSPSPAAIASAIQSGRKRSSRREPLEHRVPALATLRRAPVRGGDAHVCTCRRERPAARARWTSPRQEQRESAGAEHEGDRRPQAGVEAAPLVEGAGEDSPASRPPALAM